MSSRHQKRAIYWDTCIFLAWIKQETCWSEEITKGIEQTVEQVYAKLVVLVTSVVTLTEMLQSQMKPEHKEKYRKIFGDPQLQMVDVDRRISEKAAVIREHYDTRVFDPSGRVTSGGVMSLGDAFHLATAIHYDVDEFHTLDGAGKRKRKFDLLTLSGNVAGSRLIIMQPKYIPPPEHLAPGPASPTVGGTQLLLSQAGGEESPTESTSTTEIDEQAVSESIPLITSVPQGEIISGWKHDGPTTSEAGGEGDGKVKGETPKAPEGSV